MSTGVRKVSSGDALEWYRRGEQQLRLADAIGEADGAAMTVGFARYSAGESNDWTMSYDEALVVTKGHFAVDGPSGTTEASAGEVIYLAAGTPLVYRAIEDTELVYVSYPHWYQATLESPHASRLDEFRLDEGAV